MQCFKKSILYDLRRYINVLNVVLPFKRAESITIIFKHYKSTQTHGLKINGQLLRNEHLFMF